ncbi:DUF1003 domain-containing protein [Candidatus Wolfebacteria bacterium]|nr:DUF1003 domain-containing protein [Candidatus Wolfebacteria bacterium]
MFKDKSIRNANIEHRERFTPLERFAVWITERIGTMGFFFVLVIWTGAWFLWNVVAPISYRFDPYPGFVLWLFISNMMQLFFLPLLMIGQNLLGRHVELRAEAEFETSVKAEREIEEIIERLKKQEEALDDIRKRITNN